jgi:hypothetical protein
MVGHASDAVNHLFRFGRFLHRTAEERKLQTIEKRVPNAGTITAARDGAACGRLIDRVATGDLQSWARELDGLQHDRVDSCCAPDDGEVAEGAPRGGPSNRAPNVAGAHRSSAPITGQRPAPASADRRLGRVLRSAMIGNAAAQDSGTGSGKNLRRHPAA